jgi:asparagine synthase (glutamine-hydrolysing)
MCGICGYVSPRDDRTSIDAMQRALAHRGPDDHGTAFYAAKRVTVALGHRRLSIIDLSAAGHQPMSDARGEVSLVYNGEIYNFPELRAELERAGRRFTSRSDTEVLLLAWLEWGEAALERLNGMFAFAILDRRTDRLFLARDRAGIKPLYYFLRGGELAFASELKGLDVYAGFRREIDLDALHEYLSLQYVPSPRSIYRDTFKLEPGTVLRFELATGEATLRRFWDPVTPPAPLDPALRGSEERLLDELDRRLNAAVQRHLISDVPVGTFLSGGIDSGLVTAVASRIAGRPVRSFTIGYDEPRFDESAPARAVAAHLGTEHHEHRLRPRDLFDVIPLLVEWHDEPFANSSALPTYCVSRFAREHVKVVLSGDGGDELMGGYSTYARAAFIAGLGRGLPRSWRRGLFRLLLGHPAFAPEAITPGIPSGDALEVFHYLMARFKGRDHERLTGRRYDFSRTRFFSAYRQATDRDVKARLMLVDFISYLTDLNFAKVDRASMAHGLEVRVPLLDNEVVDFARQVPTEYKVRGRRYKHLLRRLLARYLPPALFERPKRGFGAPLDEWLRGELRPLVDTYLDPHRIRKRGLLDPEFIAIVVERHLSGCYRYKHMLWTLIVLEMWLERWIDRGSVVSFGVFDQRAAAEYSFSTAAE